MKLRGRKRATLLGIVAVALILSIAILYLVAVLKVARSGSGKVACQDNLREIVKMGMIFSDNGHRFFPIGRGTRPAAHESFNVLIAFFHGGEREVKPELFVCRSWGGETAILESDGNFRLTETTCSYAWTSERVAYTDQRPIASDKHVWSFFRQSGHYGGMNVAYTDASVEWVPAEDLGPGGLPEGLTR